MRIATIFACALWASVGLAAERTDDEEARAHFMAGQKLLDGASHQEALAEFQQSYLLTPYPAILYRIAICQDQLGRHREALATYEKYLAADPATSRKEGVVERIARLKELLKPVAPIIVTVPSAPAAAPVPVRVPVYKRWWLWTIVGAVASAGAITGAVLATRAPAEVVGSPLPELR